MTALAGNPLILGKMLPSSSSGIFSLIFLLQCAAIDAVFAGLHLLSWYQQQMAQDLLSQVFSAV
jgi:hypothetical protein